MITRFWLTMMLWCAGSIAHADTNDIEKLGWLSGCWASVGAEPGSGENWTALAGGTMLGVGRTVEHGKTTAFEFTQIRADEHGTLGYIAQPSGKPPTVFALLRMSDTEAVFENLSHDFPQRVAYRLDDPTNVTARIEGMRNGSLRVIEFPLKRSGCDAGSG